MCVTCGARPWASCTWLSDRSLLDGAGDVMPWESRTYAIALNLVGVTEFLTENLESLLIWRSFVVWIAVCLSILDDLVNPK